VYVRPFPTDQARWQVSSGGGGEPLWSHGGDRLFYRSTNGQLIQVDIIPGPTFNAGVQSPLFGTQGYAAEAFAREYDIAPDDQRFLMNRFRAASTGNRVVVVVDNWFTELRERVGN